MKLNFNFCYFLKINVFKQSYIIKNLFQKFFLKTSKLSLQIEKEKNLLKQQRDELKMRLSELSDKFQEMMIDRNLWMAQCQETVNQLRSSNEKGSSIRKEVIASI